MARYEVIRYFTDLQDNDYLYHEGDTFPREGMTVSVARIRELSGSKNLQRVPLIKKVDEPKADGEQRPKRGRKSSAR